MTRWFLKRLQVSLLMMLTVMSSPVWASGVVDAMAEAISWLVLILIPVVLAIVYWQIHYLPSKIAAKKQHPQQEAIHAMCMVSRFSGGLFWPIAFVWAHMRPTMAPLSKSQVDALEAAKKQSATSSTNDKDSSC